MTITSQDQFEQAYSEDNGGIPVAFITLQRQGDSYSVPKVARAWYWWKRARAGVVVVLPDVDTWSPRIEAVLSYKRECQEAIEAAGVAVAP